MGQGWVEFKGGAERGDKWCFIYRLSPVKVEDIATVAWFDRPDRLNVLSE